MEIKKIKNIQFSPTEEKIENDWNEVKSFKNRLLQNSDWINMPDNDLQENIVKLWVEWRKKIRKVEEFGVSNISNAMEYLNNLQNNPPPIKFKNDEYISIEHYKVELNKMLLLLIKKTTDSIYEFMDSRELVMERFEEALRYLDGKIQNNFLIDLEVDHTGMSYDEVVEKFITERKNYIIKLITIEKVKKKYLKQIDIVEDFDGCAIIKNELNILATKKWI